MKELRRLSITLMTMALAGAGWAGAQQKQTKNIASPPRTSADRRANAAAGPLTTDGPVKGSGTTNFIPLWTSGSTIGNSIMSQSTSSNVSVSGSVNLTGSLTGTTASFAGSVSGGSAGSFSNTAEGGSGLSAAGGSGNTNGATAGAGLVAQGGYDGSGQGGAGILATGGRGSNGGAGIVATGGPADVGGTGDGIDAFPETDPYTNAFAGNFSGNLNVTGAITAGTKDFKIDHPLDPANKYLYHGSVESSEMLNLYTGNAILGAGGEAAVQLPEWFEAENTDFRYQLTAIGVPAPSLYVAQEVRDHRFVIAGGQPGMKVSWQVTAVRQDAYAKAHPLEVEVGKPENERGYYIHPKLFGQPEEKQIEWARHPEMMKQLQAMRQKAEAGTQ